MTDVSSSLRIPIVPPQQSKRHRRITFSTPCFLAKVEKLSSNTKDKLKYLHQNSGSLPHFAIHDKMGIPDFYLIFLGLWEQPLFWRRQEKWLNSDTLYRWVLLHNGWCKWKIPSKKRKWLPDPHYPISLTNTEADGIQIGTENMVDFKRLSQIKEATRKAIEEEEKHRTPLTPAERRIAEQFFHLGANWQKKVTEA